MVTYRDGNLTLEVGDELHFPVEADSELAACQTTRQITSLNDVADFQFVRAWSRGFPSASASTDDVSGGAPDVQGGTHLLPSNRLDRDTLLEMMLDATSGTVTGIDVTDFVVPAGSTAVMHGAMVEIKARTVVIAGKLKFTDHLVIRCNEIRGR